MQSTCLQNQSCLEKCENKNETKNETSKISQKKIFYDLVKKKKTEWNTNDLGGVCRSLNIKKSEYQIWVNFPKKKIANLDHRICNSRNIGHIQIGALS